MQQFIFPAVVYKQDDEFMISFPDLDIFTEGNSIEEAFLFAKDYLRLFAIYSLKFDIEIPTPSSFEEVLSKSKNVFCTLLIDAFISDKDIAK